MMSAQRFRKLIARHGNTKMIISDNVVQLKLALDTINKLWRVILTEDDVISYAANQNMTWEFTVQVAPWMGDFYEGLVCLLILRKFVLDIRTASDMS